MQRDAVGQSRGKKRVGDSVNHMRVEFCNGKVGQDSLVGGMEVVVICGSLGLRAEQHGVVEGGFFVVGDCVWIGLGSVHRRAEGFAAKFLESPLT